jgi:hypothetical protein
LTQRAVGSFGEHGNRLLGFVRGEGFLTSALLSTLPSIVELFSCAFEINVTGLKVAQSTVSGFIYAVSYF